LPKHFFLSGAHDMEWIISFMFWEILA
jgi:hypothetical protein